MEARAQYMVARGESVAEALAVLESVDVDEQADTRWLALKAMLLEMAGRLTEARITRQRAVTLDPANPGVLIGQALMLERMHRPDESLQILDFGIEHVSQAKAGMLRIVRGSIKLGATGDPADWLAAVRTMREPAVYSSTAPVESQFARLRMQGRLDELAGVLARAPPLLRSALYGTGSEPTAVMRGWLALLKQEPAEAARQGRQILEFIAQSGRFPWNIHFLQLLDAQAALFVGDQQKAAQAARAALGLMPRSRDAFAWMQVATSAAPILAWSGAQDEAMALLTQLSSAEPGLPPLYIARDPLVSRPLQGNSAYRNLVTRLEMQMQQFQPAPATRQ